MFCPRVARRPGRRGPLVGSLHSHPCLVSALLVGSILLGFSVSRRRPCYRCSHSSTAIIAIFNFARSYCIRINEETFLVPWGYRLRNSARRCSWVFAFVWRLHSIRRLISSYDDHDICGGIVQKLSTRERYNQHRNNDHDVDVHNLNLFFSQSTSNHRQSKSERYCAT